VSGGDRLEGRLPSTEDVQERAAQMTHAEGADPPTSLYYVRVSPPSISEIIRRCKDQLQPQHILYSIWRRSPAENRRAAWSRGPEGTHSADGTTMQLSRTWVKHGDAKEGRSWYRKSG
jgi:hypothetical protein